MRTCVRRMSVRGKKEFEVRKIDGNERISDTAHLPTPLELEIECGLTPHEPNAGVMCHEGGVQLLLFLLAKAIPPMASVTTDPKTCSYKDVICLPVAEQKDWQDTCSQELDALKK